MRLLLALLCATSACAAPVDYATVMRGMIRWEGNHLVPYRDGPHTSVGIGHCLTAHHEPIKARYSAPEVRAMFDRDLIEARRVCRAEVRGFDDLPEEVQLAALNVIWCVGPVGFNRFKGFRFALSHRAYNAAATELFLSKWYRQVSPSRANWAINTLRSQ